VRWLLVIVIAAALPACDPPFPAPRPPSQMLVSSPGPLIGSHATLACTDCHLASSPLIATDACASCHSALVERAGLHTKPAVRGQACADCHRDHRGASFDARWGFFGGIDRFDHAYTGWKLDKGHRLGCDRCHANATTTRRIADIAAACVSCHAPPHAGTPYTKHACESCHATADDWKTLAFDHSEKTRFDVGESHRHVACASCHTTRLGVSSPSSGCRTCHGSRDPHGGRFAAFACEKCHAPTMLFAPGQAPPAWKPNAFDHGTTGWALDWQHSRTACRTCHVAPGTTQFVPLGRGKDCLGCHVHRDVHDRKYSNRQCLSCHVLPG
jgi:hypothetical protein